MRLVNGYPVNLANSQSFESFILVCSIAMAVLLPGCSVVAWWIVELFAESRRIIWAIGHFAKQTGNLLKCQLFFATRAQSYRRDHAHVGNNYFQQFIIKIDYIKINLPEARTNIYSSCRASRTFSAIPALYRASVCSIELDPRSLFLLPFLHFPDSIS